MNIKYNLTFKKLLNVECLDLHQFMTGYSCSNPRIRLSLQFEWYVITHLKKGRPFEAMMAFALTEMMTVTTTRLLNVHILLQCILFQYYSCSV